MHLSGFVSKTISIITNLQTQKSIHFCCYFTALLSLKIREDLSAQGASVSWKNRLEELGLSSTTSLCVCVRECVLYLQKCVFLYLHVYLQPCIFVSCPHSMHVLQSVAVVSAADMRPAGHILCVGGMCVAFLSHTDTPLSPLSFCSRCFMSTNRPVRRLVLEEPEGRETDWKVTRPAGNICVRKRCSVMTGFSSINDQVKLRTAKKN